MSKQLFKYLGYLLLVVIYSSCARIGRPEGGPKDEDAPIMVMSKPPYETTNFKSKEIKIYFDEYIVLKNFYKQFIVSPPLKYQPVVSPMGTPTKYLKIEIKDTLKQNTTYAFNFGSAIQDNNESNKLDNFKYIFSTGKTIDSLGLRGQVKDVFNDKKFKEVSLALYRLDSTYNDSIIYKKKPDYVTSTADSILFNFSNLRKGKYLLTGLKEVNKDYIFNPLTDKIGFSIDTIQLPRDSVLKTPIIIFEEEHPFKLKRAKEVSKGKIQFGFSGNRKGLKIELLSEVDKDFASVEAFEKGKDTLNYWFTPTIKDTMLFKVQKGNFLDTIKVRLRKKKVDSLIITPSIKGDLNPLDTFFIKTTTPIRNVDEQKIQFTDKDSTQVIFEKYLTNNKLGLLFQRKAKQKYTVRFLPETITDLYGQKNDSIHFDFSTKDEEGYGIIELAIQNDKNKHLIVQLLENDEVVRSSFVANSQKITFKSLELKEYTIRVIIDDNNDGKWSTGNFLTRKLPEKIIYFPKKISVRANWVNSEQFVIE